MLKLILLLSICLSAGAAEKSKYTSTEIRNLKYLKLEIIASKRYCKESIARYIAAQKKEESKEEEIESSEKSYKRLRQKYKCKSVNCSHSRGHACYRARTTLKKAFAVIEKNEDKLIKLAKTTIKEQKITKARKIQYANFVASYKKIRNK